MIHTILYLVSNSFNSLHMMSVFSWNEKTLIICKELSINVDFIFLLLKLNALYKTFWKLVVIDCYRWITQYSVGEDNSKHFSEKS